MHPDVAYWDHGVASVPQMTGASDVLHADDLRETCHALGIALPLTGGVLDVGCGTGRLAQIVEGSYLGLDIALSAVEYCRSAGRAAVRMDGIEDVASPVPMTWVTCVSVFTHIGHEARAAYLARFATLAPELLVDIIPGDGTGSIALYTAQPEVFERQLVEAGYRVAAVVDRPGPVTHRIYWARRA